MVILTDCRYVKKSTNQCHNAAFALLSVAIAVNLALYSIGVRYKAVIYFNWCDIICYFGRITCLISCL